MVTVVSFLLRQISLYLSYRRRLRSKIRWRAAHRFFLVTLVLWIFGSPNSLKPEKGNAGLYRRRWPAQSVAAQNTDNSASASEESTSICDGHQKPRPGAIYSTVGHVNYGVGLGLRADLSLPGACEVNLPIDVPTRGLGIDASLGLPVVEVTSPRPDGSYGAGSEITVNVRFSNIVFVEGLPILRLRTGCHENSCRTPEIQRFPCRATRGEFAISFNGETMPNIDAGTTEVSEESAVLSQLLDMEGLKHILQDFSGVERVSVEYNTAVTRENWATTGLRNKGVCSDDGTNVTVIFESVSLEGDDGDLPMLELDYMNSPMNSFTGMAWGDDQRLWYGWLNEEQAEPERAEKDLSFGGYRKDDLGKVIFGDGGLNGVELGPVEELTAGHKPADRFAVFNGGSGTDTLSFLYIVEEDDSSMDLDYYDESSLALPRNATITGENGVAVNLWLPPVGYVAVYRLGTGTSLGANKALVIDTAPPIVVQVESPNEARVYSTGEVIVINVVFNQEVVLDGDPTLLLETGVFNQKATIESSSNNTLAFKYVVQEGQSTSDLDYVSSVALSLNGGSLYQKSEKLTTEASTLLPKPGATGSLSQNEDIVIRPTTANVIDVDSSTADGEYGAGQDIYINVTFGWWDDDLTPMLLVGGSAELWMKAGWRVRATVHGAVNGSTQLVLEEGHDFTGDDIGEIVSIGTDEMTLLNVTGNEVEVSERFLGEDVLEGVSVVHVSSLGYQPAAYYSGNGTSHFIFLYTVLTGDHSTDLEYWNEGALRTEGFIRRAAKEGASAVNVSLPEPGVCSAFKGCSLGANRDIVVSTVVPHVKNITTTKPPSRGPYGVGDEIDITVWFTEPVETLANVTKSPRLRMNTGTFATYDSGFSTETIAFIYTVKEGDSTEALEAWDAPAYGELSALDVRYAGNIGYLRRAATSPTTDVDLTLPNPGSSGSLSDFVSIVVNTDVARAIVVNTSQADGSYGVGEEVFLLVTFTSSVGVNTTALNGSLPYILLNSGGTAFYQGGNGTSVLQFLYTVEEGDSSEDLDVLVFATDVTSTTAIMVPVDGAIFDVGLQSSAVVTLAKPGVEKSLGYYANIAIDTEPPWVTNITSSLANGRYGVGQEVGIFLKYNAPVTVIGVPRLWLDLGDIDGYAEFFSMRNSTTDTLLFVYVVQEGASTADLDYTSPFALEVHQNNSIGASTNSSAILRSSTNPSQNASLVLLTNGQPGSLGVQGNIWIETAAPSVERVSTTAADGVPRGIATRLQTIDVYGSPNITSGGFRLTYGNRGGGVTPCIPANSTALTANIVSDALSFSNSFLSVTVEEDDPPFDGARRFVVQFNEPEFGLGILGVAEYDEDVDCEQIQCWLGGDDDADEYDGETCDDSGVLINRDVSTFVEEGAVEVVLHFTAPIYVNTTFGSPILLLRVDPTTSINSTVATPTDTGIRYANYIPGLTQFVDIGVDATRPVTRGHFRLSYGGAISGCMDINSAESAAGGYSVKSRLEELEEINLLGVQGVTREARGNGFRFSIIFRGGNPDTVDVPSNNVTEGCFVDFDPPLEPSDFYVSDIERMSFLYILQSGDTSDGLQVASSDSLVLNGSTILRVSTYPSQAANLTLVSGSEVDGGGTTSGLPDFLLRGGDNSLPVVIDCSKVPVVKNVTATAFAGEYGAGQRVYFQVEFSTEVVVDESGSPELLLETGKIDSPATFYMGNGTSVLTFRSTIQEGDSAVSLGPYSRTSFGRNGGFVRSASFHASVDAYLRLPTRSGNYSADEGAIIIDTSVPQVTSLFTSKENNVYGEGEEVALHIVYTHKMDVLGTPVVPLNSGGEASYTLRGRTQIVSVAADDDADFAFGPAQVTAGSFRLHYEGETTECIGFNSSDDAVSALRNLSTFSDGGIDNVTVSSSKGGYRFEISMSSGDAAYESYPLAIEVPWNYYEGCTVFVPANTKPTRVVENTLIFLYQVKSLDMAFRLDIENSTSISVDESSYVRRHQSSSVTDGNTTLPDEPLRMSGSYIVVNTTQPVVISVHGANGNGPFGYSEEVEIGVEFSLPVTVSDAETTDNLPVISVIVGSVSTARTVTYLTTAAVYTTEDLFGGNDSSSHISGSNDSGRWVFFKYFVAADDESTDLRYLSSSSLKGDIRRKSSNPLAAADTTLPIPGDNGSLSHHENIVINAADQKTFVHKMTRAPSAGNLGIGDEAMLTVHFSRKVHFTGEEPALALATSTPVDVVTCSSPLPGYYADSFSFLYVVSPGDASSDLSYTSTSALNLSSSTDIEDESGVTANITLPEVGSSISVTGGDVWEAEGALVVDTSSIALYVTALNENGIYYPGASIFIQVTYNNDVTVVGTPLLTLRVGDAPYYNRRAVYSSGSETSTLIFEYIVEVGDHTIHLDYDGTNALYLPTATEASDAAVRSKYDKMVDADPTLPAVWLPDTLGARKSIMIAGDVTPTVKSITSKGTPNGTYGVGENIDLEVIFTTRIFVKNSLSLPYVLVEVGEERRGKAQASYIGGNMTDILVFRYTVIEGDETDAFDIIDTRTTKRQMFSTALVRPPAAEIRAASERPTVDARLFLNLPGTTGTISFENIIALDTEAPYVRSVVVTSGDGVYGTGDEITLACSFSQPVVVVGEDVGIPSIGLGLGRLDHDARATYYSGNGTDEFEFSYTVQNGDYTNLLDYESAEAFLLFQTWHQTMERSGAAIKRASTIPSQDADLTLAPPGDPLTALGRFSIVAMGSKVAVQTENVRALGAASFISNGTYPEGSVIPVIVTFSVEVFVLYGIPSLSLKVSENGATALASSNSSDDSNASWVTNGNTTVNSTIVTTTSYANYTSGNGTSELLFTYRVGAGDATDRLDYSSPAANALSAPFGSIVVKNTLEPVYLRSLPEPGTEGSLGWNNDIVISDEVLLVEKVWTSTPDGTYGAGERIDIYVGFRFPMILESQTAFLTINTQIGGYAVELSGKDSATNALVFSYTVQEGHKTAALDMASASALNGTVHLNASYATSPINITLPEPGDPGSLSYDKTLVIETSSPYVINTTSTQPNGTYTAGAMIGISVVFNLPVAVIGVGPANCTASGNSGGGSITSTGGSDGALCEGLPVLRLDTSGKNGDKNATFARGNETAELIFEYEVEDGDGSSRLDYSSTLALSADIGEILRVSANPVTPADLKLPLKGTTGSLGWSSEVLVDTAALFAVDVNSSKLDGVYSVGEEIYINVYMSAPVEIQGIPYLELNSGPNAKAVYKYGGNSDGVLSFLYTVSEGDQARDLDTKGQNSFRLPEGAIVKGLRTSIYQSKSTVATESVSDARPPNVLLQTGPGAQGSLGLYKNLVIDTSPPYVVNVASNKPNEEYGAGEEIDVTVTFNYPVEIISGAVLLIDTADGRSPREAPYLSGNHSIAFTFLYTVAEGDHSVDLGTYDGGDTSAGGGLVGTVLRASDKPTQAANTTLPVSGEDGSLAVNNDIVIDTTAPYVVAVLSLREGIYTLGQPVDLQVIYDKPVNVSGTPRLGFNLDSANGTYVAAYAYYDAWFDVSSFAEGARALPFVYTVRTGDDSTYFKHTGSDALELYENATIKRASTHPTTDALINLPVSEGGSLIDLVTKTEVIVRGLYHASASDLEITLLHQEHSCVLSALTEDNNNARPAGVQFGAPENRRYMRGFGPNPATSTGAPSRPAYRHRGIGYDYAFADVVGKNVAQHEQAVSRQSSISFGGVSGGAVDGKSSRFFSDGSTSMTSLEVEPWWQVTLAKPYTLGYIRLFGQEEEIKKYEIQTITVRSKSALGGSFTLNVTDYLGASEIAGDIYYNAVAAFGDEKGNDTGTGTGESLETKLEGLSIISSVEVTRSSSSTFTKLYQRTWTVTFLSPTGDLPQMKLGSDAGLTSYGNTFTFATIQDGTTQGGVYVDGVTQKINAVLGPSWVMIFDSVETVEGLESLEQAKANAGYSVYLPDNKPEVNIPIAGGVIGLVIRVQLEGMGYLSISELQAYELSFLPLSKSMPSNPVPAREEWNPIQAEESLTAAFEGTAVSGQWILRLRDTTVKEPNSGIGRAAIREAHGDGGVAGWELVVTDFLGNIFRFTTDSLFTVETLPKFGRLFTVSTAAEAAVAAEALADGANDNHATSNQVITAAHGFNRHLGPCRVSGSSNYGYSSRRCLDAFGGGPVLSTRVLGAVAARNLVKASAGGGAKIWYMPEKDYLGPDDFSFSVIVGGVKSAEAWIAGLHTRRCRLFEEGVAHDLCVCENQPINLDEDQQGICYSAVEGVCANEWPGLGGNKTDSNARLHGKMKVRMCKACGMTFQGQLTAMPTFSDYTTECLAEIGKISDWLVKEGYCQETYAFPLCDNEAFDPVGTPIEGPDLGVERAVRLERLGSRQTDKTDFRKRFGTSASGSGECRCTQAPDECSCRENAWANRQGR